ncbi:MAG TPA: MmgE/PrpD family protein [Mycobacterium sp.]
MTHSDERLTESLAERSAGLTFTELPDDVITAAQTSILDWLGVTLAGSQEPGPRHVLALQTPVEVAGVEVFGHAVRLSPLQAALVNGTSSHVLDFDDVNTFLIGHPSVAIVAAALALGESLHCTGPQLICAYVAGYETACRVSAAVGAASYVRGFHNTGTIGTFGAAAACAHLLGLDTACTATALSLAATQAAGLGCMVGTMAKSLHAGKACQNGVFAALLAREGFTAGDSAIESPKGFAATASGTCDTATALGEPPQGWHVLNNLFKFDASCYMTHSTLAGVRELMAEHDLAATEIDGIDVHLGEVEMATCAIPSPTSGLEVKFSAGHLAAMAALRRQTTVIDDASARDDAVIEFRRRTVTVIGDGMSGAPTRVDVRLRDGRGFSAAVDVNTPDRDLHTQAARVEQKFRAVTAPWLDADRADAVVAATKSLVNTTDVRQLVQSCRL